MEQILCVYSWCFKASIISFLANVNGCTSTRIVLSSDGVAEHADLSFQMTLYTNILWLLPKDCTLLAVPMLLWRENLELTLLLVPRHRVTISTSLWNTKRKCIRLCVRACDEHAKVCKTKRPRSAEKKLTTATIKAAIRGLERKKKH